MRVEIVASTSFHHPPGFPYKDQYDASHSDTLAEAAGRLCYLSWERPNPATADNEGYLANILAQGHESVLEHSSVSFYVTGASRALLTELTRHRHLSFSVVSQRYVDATQLGKVVPPVVYDLPDDVQEDMLDDIYNIYHLAVRYYEDLVEALIDSGLPRKKAREAARCVLPNGTESPMIVTGNLRAWRDVLKKRHHVAADAELQEFADLALAKLRLVAPHSFQDIPNEPYGEN